MLESVLDAAKNVHEKRERVKIAEGVVMSHEEFLRAKFYKRADALQWQHPEIL